jgi:small subunit ribosomal protein S13
VNEDENKSFLRKIVQTNYGVNVSMSEKIFKNLGVNVRINSDILKRRKQTEINRKLAQKITGKKLKDKIKATFSFLSKNKTYKGIRHKFKYPARGQRTHTNARTKKKFKF